MIPDVNALEENLDIYNPDDVGDELFSEAFFRTLLRMQSSVIQLDGKKEHYDIYLAKQIFPVLVPGMEALSEEVE